jgi:uncharacterized protein YecE (DUF72 family)
LLYAGTSGFAYPSWAPRFYPPGSRPADLLRLYAGRLTACELNNTYYQQPTEAKVAAWLAATPASFRFAVKAQRSGSLRAIRARGGDAVSWLTRPLGWFGDRLGSVLFRVPDEFPLDLPGLDGLLAAWPARLPLTVELRHPSWQLDEVFARLRATGVSLCATELPEDPAPPPIRHTGASLYLRLRRHEYATVDLEAWAERLVPFLDDGADAFVFFRHDEAGRATEFAVELAGAVRRRLPAAVPGG